VIEAILGVAVACGVPITPCGVHQGALQDVAVVSSTVVVQGITLSQALANKRIIRRAISASMGDASGAVTENNTFVTGVEDGSSGLQAPFTPVPAKQAQATTATTTAPRMLVLWGPAATAAASTTVTIHYTVMVPQTADAPTQATLAAEVAMVEASLQSNLQKEGIFVRVIPKQLPAPSGGMAGGETVGVVLGVLSLMILSAVSIFQLLKRKKISSKFVGSKSWSSSSAITKNGHDEPVEVMITI
jgi:hypothetical protein